MSSSLYMTYDPPSPRVLFGRAGERAISEWLSVWYDECCVCSAVDEFHGCTYYCWRWLSGALNIEGGKPEQYALLLPFFATVFGCLGPPLPIVAAAAIQELSLLANKCLSFDFLFSRFRTWSVHCCT